ncbi:MAG: response regulator transcription factor [Alphaproteobacteria bacterium]|nr:response regulator transcription factor [Alphaproteobacteria bacterium]
MIRAVIVDDVDLARERVRLYLKDETDIVIVGEAEDGESALALLQREKPDLAFLDIGLSDLDGIALLAALPVDVRPCAIYLTAHDDRAVDAFDVAAIDYLLKPFSRDRFAQALDRARRTLQTASGTPERARLVVKDGTRIDLVPIAQIDYIDAAGHYLCLHVGTKVHLLRMSLTDLQSQLDPSRFVRVHRSAIVQIDRILALRSLRNGDGELMLKGGAKLGLSRTYADNLRARLGLSGT